MASRRKIVIIQRIFSSYRKSVYDLITEDYDLTVLHSLNNSGINTTSTSYSKIIQSIKYGNRETSVYLRCIRELTKIKPEVVIQEFAIGILSIPTVYLWCKLFRKKFILWSHGYDRKKGFCPEKSFSDKYRLWLMKRADSIILYGDKDKRLFSNYIDPAKIFVANNTLDTNKLLSLRNKLENEGRENVKRRLGFNTKFNIIFIGRLLHDKKPHLLIEIVESLPQYLVSDLTIHFVGDGLEKERLINSIQQKNLNDKFIFHGKIHDDDLSGSLLFASDIMVMPGDVGLSVNHSFCFQCPVITFESSSSGPYHGPEEAYIKDGETGFRIQHGNIIAMTHSIQQYLLNNEMQDSIRANIINYVRTELTIERMVEGVVDCVEYVKNNS